jgi:cytochrome c-type biogenesis protein CcmF
VRGAMVIAARSGVNLMLAIGQLTMRNTRRYGGYIIHLGMVVIFIGIAGQAFNKDVQQELGPGEQMKIGNYTIIAQNFDDLANANYQAERATLDIVRNGKSEMMLYPERRFFLASQVTETMVAIQSTPLHDLYIVYAGRSPENNRPVIHAYLNPLVKCIWFGGIVVVLGTILALIPSTQPVMVIGVARSSELVPAMAGFGGAGGGGPSHAPGVLREGQQGD